jgi:hypothetical protein
MYRVAKYFKMPQTWNDLLARNKQLKKDMGFGKWNAIESAAGELQKYNLDLVGIQEVGVKGRDIKQQTTINFLYKIEKSQQLRSRNC